MDRSLRARVLLSEAEILGLTLEDLVAASQGTATASVRRTVPTVAEYVERITPSFTNGTLRTYRSYWRLAIEMIGDKSLDMVTVDDCEAIVVEAARRAKLRRPGTDARSPKENCVAALRALFKRAKRTRLILENPAAEVDKPRRLPNRRRSLNDIELTEALEAIRMTSRDPELDLLLAEFHLVSGARQEGALHLVLDDLDERRSTVWLREKFGKEREQPISWSLMTKLKAHARRRGACHGRDAVFRTSRGRPITRRHYDTLFKHVQEALPWSVRTPVTAHVLSHTAAAAVERVTGSEAVAEAFLGHAPQSVTGTYTKGRLGEVAAAVALITGEPHPLAEPLRRPHHAAV